MRLVKNSKRVLLLVVVLLTSLITSPPGAAYATSAYDATITTASGLVLKCEDGSTIDVTNRWLTFVNDTTGTVDGITLSYTVNATQRNYWRAEFATQLGTNAGWAATTEY